MDAYFLLFLVVMGINLLPAFGPPTWSVLILYSFNSNLAPIPMILVAAAAAATGRYLLALAFRKLGHHLPSRYRHNLESAREVLETNRRGGLLALGLFALSPVPSAQLFGAAGMTGVRLLPFTLAFFTGRLVSYSIYIFAASKVRDSDLGQAFLRGLTDPLNVALQLALIGLLFALTQIDWRRVMKR